MDFLLGWYLEPIVTGHYPDSMIKYVPAENLAPFTHKEAARLQGTYDFLGLNYYTSIYAANDPDPTAEDGYYRDMHVKFDSFRDNVPIGPLLETVPYSINHLATDSKSSSYLRAHRILDCHIL
ncbi:Oleuropein beta-glucosidase [Sesamum angolense]|uniref:Oleuropein beta-glucosidase n=1 Tax=Sesamum angolense TaxID=2727404 RepID=A0AAE1WL79_9LAMI|nr:Oleuropein beta-glucosidase [Sesamum angolense]